MRVLLVAAHPDDEVLGPGGAILRHARQGDQVAVCILTDGGTGRYEEPGIAALRRSAERCAEFLGVRDLRVLDFPNQRLELTPAADLARALEEEIRRVRPDVLYTHHRGDINPDHRAVFQASLIAARPLPETGVARVLSYEVPSSTEWGAPGDPGGFQPNLFVDVTEVLEEKVRAFLAYESEVRPYPHPRSPEALRAIAQRWGTVAGLRAAEAFVVVRDTWR
ncbi:MAG: PIG-L family deacetylase [Chloroflexi bacterium]|nr:PIG-L family deacetylase [Chloroflexota bacterium]